MNFDLEKVLQFPTVSWFTPIVPGGILALGFSVSRPDQFKAFFEVPELGYSTKIAIAVFIAWVIGALLKYAVQALTAVVAIARLPKFDGKASKFMPWRRVARRVLGDELAPRFDETSMVPALENLLVSIRNLPDSDKKSQIITAIETNLSELRMADLEWQEWHSVLGSFVGWESSKTADRILSGVDLLATVHTTAWALLVVAFINSGWESWHVWVAMILVLVAAVADFFAFTDFISTQQDRFGVRLTADLFERATTTTGTSG